jgi:hypothetical protein
MEAHAQFAVKTTESTSLKKQADIENESATSNATIGSILASRRIYSSDDEPEPAVKKVVKAAWKFPAGGSQK